MKSPRAVLAGAVAALVALSVTAGIANSAPSAPETGIRVTAAAPAPEIPVENVMAHLNQFQTIATNNGGNRAHGKPGYRASADYVKGKLDAAGFTTTLQPFTHNGATGWNVIAEWPYGDASKVVMAGAHLDSVPAGAGLNDNASGSSAVLEVALQVSRSALRPEKRLRFGWWGAEELGLIGSKFYADNLGATERAKITAYLNFDMVGQKDVTTWGVYNHNATISGHFKEYFAAKNIPTTAISWNGSSDHSSFTKYNIVVGGIGSGTDPCYHSACDTISNVGARTMGHSTNAIAHTVWKLAGVGDAPSDFSLAVSPTAGTAKPGTSVTATVSTAVTGGQSQPIGLSATGLPAGVTASFSPVSVQAGQSSTLTLAVASTTALGTYPITIGGRGDVASKATTYTLTVATDTPAGCRATNDADVTIRDNATVESKITLTGCATQPSATSKVDVRILHTYQGDLVVSLIAPDGSAYTLHNRTGSSTDNIIKVYTLDLRPETANGPWTLRVRDAATNDVGKIDTWTLDLQNPVS